MDLTEAVDIKKRWQEYTEELYKKDIHDTDNHDGVIIHLEPDILECEIKGTLGSITIVIIWVMKIFLYSSPVYSCHLFLISSASVSPYHFCPFLRPSLHEIFPRYL